MLIAKYNNTDTAIQFVVQLALKIGYENRKYYLEVVIKNRAKGTKTRKTKCR